MQVIRRSSKMKCIKSRMTQRFFVTQELFSSPVQSLFRNTIRDCPMLPVEMNACLIALNTSSRFLPLSL